MTTWDGNRGASTEDCVLKRDWLSGITWGEEADSTGLSGPAEGLQDDSSHGVAVSAPFTVVKGSLLCKVLVPSGIE